MAISLKSPILVFLSSDGDLESGAPHLSHHPRRFLQYECLRQKYRRHIFVDMKFVWHASVISSENVGLFYGLFTFIYWKDLGISLAMHVAITP